MKSFKDLGVSYAPADGKKRFPGPSVSIRELVNRLIDAQVAEGYFKECPITFRDIAYAKTVLIEKLKTIYHTRISYPELKK